MTNRFKCNIDEIIDLIVKYKYRVIDLIEDKNSKKIADKLLTHYSLHRLAKNDFIKYTGIDCLKFLYDYIFMAAATGEYDEEFILDIIKKAYENDDVDDDTAKTYQETIVLLIEKRRESKNLEEYYLHQLDILSKYYVEDVNKLGKLAGFNSIFITKSSVCFVIETLITTLKIITLRIKNGKKQKTYDVINGLYKLSNTLYLTGSK